MFEVYKSDDGWRWRLTIDGKQLAVSVNAFAKRVGAINEIKRLKARVAGAPVIESIEAEGISS